MGKIGLFYGSDWGNTEKIARLMQEVLGEDLVDIYDVASEEADKIVEYDRVIIGCSTSEGHGLATDWRLFYPKLDHFDFRGKRVAFFGLGDQKEFPDHFVDALGILYDKITDKGATVIGGWSTKGYEFTASAAVKKGSFVGLVIDEDNQPDLTETRVEKWAAQVRKGFDLKKHRRG